MRLCIAAIALVGSFENPATAAQLKYQPGDRVECEVTGNSKGRWWMQGTVLPFKQGDFGAGIQPDGSWYRFKADADREYPCKPEVLRAIVGAKTSTHEAHIKNVGEIKGAVAEQKNGARFGGDFLACPVEQKQVENGARPNAGLLKNLIRCKKGEKPAEKGFDGAVRVDVVDIKIGEARPWSYRQDIGNGKASTTVYPVKATYTVKTLYQTATEVEENWIRILNVYVNAFGEWQVGSEEHVKSPTLRRIEN